VFGRFSNGSSNGISVYSNSPAAGLEWEILDELLSAGIGFVLLLLPRRFVEGRKATAAAPRRKKIAYPKYEGLFRPPSWVWFAGVALSVRIFKA